MATTVSCLLPEHSVVEFHHVGVVTEEELATAFGEMVALAQANDIWHVMSDCTDLTEGPRFLEMLPFVEALRGFGVKERFRQALVRPVDVKGRAAVDYWHASMTDHGLTVLSFDHRSEALGWLATQP